MRPDSEAARVKQARSLEPTGVALLCLLATAFLAWQTSLLLTGFETVTLGDRNPAQAARWLVALLATSTVVPCASLALWFLWRET